MPSFLVHLSLENSELKRCVFKKHSYTGENYSLMQILEVRFPKMWLYFIGDGCIDPVFIF